MERSLHELSIVVVGAMNPAIHHPAWYRDIGSIDKGEADAALAGPIVCTPAFAQWSLEGIQVQCTHDRWIASTSDETQSGRVEDLAATTFHRLHDTPIGAYGFNHRYDVPVRVESVGEYLASVIRGGGLPLPNATHCQASVKFYVSLEDRLITIAIEQSKGEPSSVRFSQNSHHSTGGLGEFDLEPLIREGLKSARGHAQKAMTDCLSPINEKREA